MIVLHSDGRLHCCCQDLFFVHTLVPQQLITSHMTHAASLLLCTLLLLLLPGH
jgi:hypothetical protein